MLPKSLRNAWKDEELPGWAISELQLESPSTFERLDSDVWRSVHQMSERLRNLLIWMVHSRDDAIGELVVIAEPWPAALEFESLPWKIRTRNCLEKSSLI